MITLTDVKPRDEVPFRRAQVSPLADCILHVALYVCILSSFFVFVQPAPYEYLVVLLALACLVARVSINRMVLPVLILLLIRDASGAVALIPILHLNDSFRFLATSFYLGLTATIFACIFAQDTTRRLATIRSSYVLAGVLASLLGTMGYFNLYFNFFPGLEVFSLNDRALAGFKDPNVLGVFLIPPLLWLIEGFVVDKIRPYNLVASIIIFVGLLLAFSRAAWGSFAFAIVLLMYFLFITQAQRRMRIIAFTLTGAIAVVVIFVLLFSIDVVHNMFLQRATLLQEYDSGIAGSRFDLQQNSLKEILAHPIGMGPWGFSKVYGQVSHNTYLGTTLNYGWVGGFAYLILVLLTLGVGFRVLWIRTPWQTFFIATYLPFLALALEAFVVDTDHWRHFYLLLGLVWGLSAATMNFMHEQQTAAFQPRAPGRGMAR